MAFKNNNNVSNTLVDLLASGLYVFDKHDLFVPSNVIVDDDEDDDVLKVGKTATPSS